MGHCARLHNYQTLTFASNMAQLQNQSTFLPALPLTILSAIDLWKRLWEVTNHIHFPEFAFLPHPGPPPPVRPCRHLPVTPDPPVPPDLQACPDSPLFSPLLLPQAFTFLPLFSPHFPPPPILVTPIQNQIIPLMRSQALKSVPGAESAAVTVHIHCPS